jgi:hypothetical protein
MEIFKKLKTAKFKNKRQVLIFLHSTAFRTSEYRYKPFFKMLDSDPILCLRIFNPDLKTFKKLWRLVHCTCNFLKYTALATKYLRYFFCNRSLNFLVSGFKYSCKQTEYRGLVTSDYILVWWCIGGTMYWDGGHHRPPESSTHSHLPSQDKVRQPTRAHKLIQWARQQCDGYSLGCAGLFLLVFIQLVLPSQGRK